MLSMLLLVVVGCSSAPREVDASIALVSHDSPILLGKKVPFSIGKHLGQSVLQTITHKNYTIDISAVYRSALGFNCTTLIFKTQVTKNIAKIACQNKKSDDWMFIKSINNNDKQVEL